MHERFIMKNIIILIQLFRIKRAKKYSKFWQSHTIVVNEKPIHKKYSFIAITGKPYYFLSLFPLIPHEAVVYSFNFETWFWEKKVLQVIDTFLKRTHKRERSQELRDGACRACIRYEVISSVFLTLIAN